MNVRSTILAVSSSAAAIAVTLLAAGPSVAGGHAGTLSHPLGKGICFSNLTDRSDVAIISQNFGAGENPYASQGADDFTLPKTCKVSTVGIDGLTYNGVADSFIVKFYKNKAGLPGKLVSTVTSHKVGSCPAQASCDIAITLPAPVKLKKGVGWVSVQADLSLGEGEFVWTTGLTQSGAPAVWQNPGDGLGTGCTTWADLQTCWPSWSPGPDFEFVLLK